MANPFDQFDSANSNPFDQFDGGETPKKKQKASPTMSSEDIDKYLGGMRGITEAGVGMLAGMPAQIAGGLYGLGTYLSGQGIDKAAEDVKRIQESNFGLGAYKAPSEEGRQASEKLGEAFQMPGKAVGYVGQKVGGDLGEFIGQTATDMAMNFLPIHGAKSMKGSVKDFAKTEQPRGPNLELINQETAAKPIEQPRGQLDLFPETLSDTTGHATPYDAREMGNFSEVTPKRSRRQMELQLDENNPINIDAAGVSLRPEDMNAVEAMKQRELERMDAIAKAEMAKETPTDYSPNEGLNGQRPLFDYSSEGRMPNPTEAVTGDWRIDENGMPVKVDLSMDVANAENPLQRNLWGDELPQKHEQENPVNLPQAIDSMPSQPWRGDPRDQALARLQGELPASGEMLGSMESARRANEAGQTGGNPFGDETLMHTFGGKMLSDDQQRAIGTALRTGATDQKVQLDVGLNNQHVTLTNIPGVKAQIGDIKPDMRSPEQFIAEEAPKGGKDVDQNFVQRVSNYFTKGGQYQAIKTQHPIVKYVVDAVTAASRNAKAEVATVVHDKLAPAARALDSQEKADVWAAQVIAEQNKKPLTSDMMERAGFNEKQIAWVEIHTQVMKDMLAKLNEAAKLAGEGPVSPRIAYLASRATGDFRTLLYKEVNGEKTPVAILGANTRARLKSDLAKLQEAHPEWIAGEEKFFGGGSRHGSADMNAAIELLAKNNPDVALLAEHVNEILTKDAFNYMNAKSHTMEKKGISGMEGRKELSNAIENAKDGMQAQINYAERMIEWSNLSKAVDQVKPVLKSDNGLDMPNAKEWSNKYLQRALGNNPGELGRAIDNVFAAGFAKAGVGPSVIRRTTAQARSLINGMLLGFGNLMFLGMNLIQPVTSMPGMASFLRGRGVDSGALGYNYLAKSMAYAWADVSGKPVPPLIRDALSYAKDSHVYSSDLFDSSNRVNNDATSFWEKGTQFGASQVEMRTRQAAYLSYVQMLNEAGIKKGDGLFETAHNLTDMQMNNYAKHEMPSFYSEITGNTLGSNAANLMSYKHNEYSRLAMFAREMKQSGTPMPMVVQLMSSVAFAGVLGTIGYSEADAIVKAISTAFGKPTSLTKIMLDNPNIPDMVKGGVGTTFGGDWTSRLGTGPLVPQHLIDAVAPGAGKLVNMAGAAKDLVTDRSEFAAKNFVREWTPNSMSGIIDRAWFSKDNPQGQEMGINRNTGKAAVTRNAADVAWKSVGGTGWNEAQQKSSLWENQQIDKAYSDMRKSVLEAAQKQITINGTVPDNFAQKYIKAQGDPNSLEKEVVKMYIDGNLDKLTAQKLLKAGSSSLTATHSLLRLLGEE